MSDEGKVILFPTDRIKNRANTGATGTNKFQKQIEKEQTSKFIESAVDDIAMKLLHNFVDLAMKTQTDTFTKDFSYLVDCLRSTIKRDFGLNHIVHKIVDNTVVHQVDMSLFPNWIGTDLIRTFEFQQAGNQLLLSTTLFKTRKGHLVKQVLLWERM